MWAKLPSFVVKEMSDLRNSPGKNGSKMTALPAVISNSKSIQILETLSKTAHQSHLYQRLRLCSLEAICLISGLCVSTSIKESETNKERTVQTEPMREFLKKKILAALMPILT